MKIGAGLVLAALVPLAQAGNIVVVAADFAGNDTVDWGQLGVVGTTPPNPFTALSTNTGETVTVTNLGDGGSSAAKSILADPSAWGFSGSLLALNNQFQGPTTIGFSSPVMGVGFYLSYAFGGLTFDQATIQAFDGLTSLGTYGTNAPGGGAVLFIGVVDATADITSIEIQAYDTSDDEVDYFALDTLQLIDTAPDSTPSSSTPEPSTLMLTSLVLLLPLFRTGTRLHAGRFLLCRKIGRRGSRMKLE